MTIGTGFPEAPLGSVLTDVEIRRLVAEHQLIHPFDEHALQGASYDLTVGDECNVRGRTHILTAMAPDIEVGPGEFVLLLSNECLRVPEDVVAHAGLISKWAQRGLVSLFSPQIDPGFHGHIIVPLFNASHRPVRIRLGERMFTIEFVRTTACASVSWSTNGQKITQIPDRPRMQLAGPDLSEVNRQIHAVRSDVAGLRERFDGYESGAGLHQGGSQVRAAWLAVGLAILALVSPVIWHQLGVG